MFHAQNSADLSRTFLNSLADLLDQLPVPVIHVLPDLAAVEAEIAIVGIASAEYLDVEIDTIWFAEKGTLLRGYVIHEFAICETSRYETI